ncbi:hypothetical protein L2E82_26693 [Cichorium intybus]|uniref:Uncharacterized protein n=1 Tax=Cichorium intybus TaxID=13427 RepID=A0ACB9CQW0_CICIN|nr:hypothetical protein L2E82_26693 [Cichorium intybus]
MKYNRETKTKLYSTLPSVASCYNGREKGGDWRCSSGGNSVNHPSAKTLGERLANPRRVEEVRGLSKAMIAFNCFCRWSLVSRERGAVEQNHGCQMQKKSEAYLGGRLKK